MGTTVLILFHLAVKINFNSQLSWKKYLETITQLVDQNAARKGKLLDFAPFNWLAFIRYVTHDFKENTKKSEDFQCSYTFEENNFHI